MNEEEHNRLSERAFDMGPLGGRPSDIEYQVVPLSKTRPLEGAGRELLQVELNGYTWTVFTIEQARAAVPEDGLLHLRTKDGWKTFDPGDIPPGHGLAIGVPPRPYDPNDPMDRHLAEQSGRDPNRPG